MEKVQVAFGESAPSVHPSDRPGTLQGMMFKALMKYLQDTAKAIVTAAKDFDWERPEVKTKIAMVSMEGWLPDRTAWATVSLIGTLDGGVTVMVGMGLKEAEKRNASNSFIAPISEQDSDTVKTVVRMLKDLKDSVAF